MPPVEDYAAIRRISERDAQVLEEKGKTYGRSWLKRGGVGAMMMLSRKWDRIENIVKEHGWDVIAAGYANAGDIMDDIGDLRRYLLLVEAEVNARSSKVIPAEYIDPDRGGGTG